MERDQDTARHLCDLSINACPDAFLKRRLHGCLANPFSKAEAEAGALSRALLYRTALVQTVPTAQAEAVPPADREPDNPAVE